MRQRLTPEFVMVLMVVTLVGTGLVSVTGFHHFGEIIAEGIGAAPSRELHQRMLALLVVTRRYVVLAIVLSSIGIFCSLLFYYRIMSHIYHPLERLQEYMDQIPRMQGMDRLSIQTSPRIDLLARSCNRLAESFAQMRDESQRSSGVVHRQAVALIETFKAPALVVDQGGGVLLANHTARALLTGAQGAQITEALGTAIRSGENTLQAGRIQHRIHRCSKNEEADLAGMVITLCQIEGPKDETDRL